MSLVFEQNGQQMASLAGTRLNICIKPQQTAEMNTPQPALDSGIMTIVYQVFLRWYHLDYCQPSANQKTITEGVLGK